MPLVMPNAGEVIAETAMAMRFHAKLLRCAEEKRTVSKVFLPRDGLRLILRGHD